MEKFLLHNIHVVRWVGLGVLVVQVLFYIICGQGFRSLIRNIWMSQVLSVLLAYGLSSAQQELLEEQRFSDAHDAFQILWNSCLLYTCAAPAVMRRTRSGAEGSRCCKALHHQRRAYSPTQALLAPAGSFSIKCL